MVLMSRCGLNGPPPSEHREHDTEHRASLAEVRGLCVSSVPHAGPPRGPFQRSAMRWGGWEEIYPAAVGNQGWWEGTELHMN